MDAETKKTMAIGAVAGALIGAGLGVLLAPQQGQKVRAKLADVADMVKETGALLNETGRELSGKGQEVAGVIKETVSVAKDIKDETVSAAQGVKTEIQNFKSQP